MRLLLYNIVMYGMTEMEDGRIAEEGSYEELAAAGGLFAKLVARQVA